MEIKLEANVLSANDRIAQENRRRLAEHGIFCLNLISSPGAGKTTLLERTCELLRGRLRVGVIEGDITTSLDADRIARHGVPAHQINTMGACHLDARMVQKALEKFALAELDLLIIENVGNLVCPADFDLGEDAKVVVLSVPEGDDKPAKYPAIFQRSAVLLLNKIDLLPQSNFDLARVRKDLEGINPGLRLMEVSALHGTGLDQWIDWLQGRVQAKRKG
ncbi:MAG: hydrogenase nickel incorporation protein HypB [Bacillota bacterium]|nr:hydrogenase nickel incorporation protein HypB [Bacillota bacterium]